MENLNRHLVFSLADMKCHNSYKLSTYFMARSTEVNSSHERRVSSLISFVTDKHAHAHQTP